MNGHRRDRSVWLCLIAFTLCVFTFGRYADRWHFGSGDHDSKVNLLIYAFASVVFCWALIRQILKMADQ